MRLELKCEGCGAKRHYIWDLRTIPDVSKAYKDGWRSVKGKIYCPACKPLDAQEDYDSMDVFWQKLFEQLPHPRK